MIPKPNVKNIVKIGNFRLIVYAYRKITLGEAKLAAKEWLKSRKQRTFPKRGQDVLITIFGYDEQ